MNSMQPSSKTICVSHLKDVDGLICAAIIRSAIKANFMLTNYGNITTCFSKIRQNYDHVYICDLGLNENHLNSITRVRQFADVTYIDHHQLNLKLILPETMRDKALRLLQARGFTATGNGIGLHVAVSPWAKMAPLQVLLEENIEIRDFEVDIGERHAHSGSYLG